MKIVAWIVGVIAVIGLAFGGLMYKTSESGEVVELTTTDAGGAQKTTRIWVVDVNGSQWLRSGSPASTWLERIKVNQHVTVKRAGKSAEYTAAPTPAMHDEINNAMRAKYGKADQIVAMFADHSQSIPIQLIPRS